MLCHPGQNNRSAHGGQPRRGIILVLAAFCLIMILAFAAFTVDVGYILVTKAELQNTTDAAVLAATQVLIENPDAERADVIAAATDVINASSVAQGTVTMVADDDLEIGSWDYDADSFAAIEGDDISAANAIRVTLQLAESRDTALPLFFAPVIGHDNSDLVASAISAIGHDRARDVMLVIDVSGSMGDNNRMEFTKQAALHLADKLTDEDRLGLSVYSYPIIIPDPPDDDDDDDDDDGDDDD